MIFVLSDSSVLLWFVIVVFVCVLVVLIEWCMCLNRFSFYDVLKLVCYRLIGVLSVLIVLCVFCCMCVLVFGLNWLSGEFGVLR